MNDRARAYAKTALIALMTDVGVGLVWALLLLAAALFSGGTSEFIYIDF